MAKFIFLNGPPGCGKDSSALHLAASNGTFVVEKFAMPLKRAFAGVLGVGVDNVGFVSGWSHQKGVPVPVLGVSEREWEIDFSENYMKVKYGPDIFGRLLIDRIASVVSTHPGTNFAISDSGFITEAEVVGNSHGWENCVLLRIHRPGYDFSGDSRSYLEDSRFFKQFDVINGGTEQELWEKVGALATAFISGEL